MARDIGLGIGGTEGWEHHTTMLMEDSIMDCLTVSEADFTCVTLCESVLLQFVLPELP
jgi:hypothetical protein